MGKSFVDEFEVKEEKFNFNDVPDYEAFENKELLDELIKNQAYGAMHKPRFFIG